MKRIALVFTLLAACTTGAATNAACPTENAPTYAGFGQPFFATYCTGCHSATASDRHGAPAGQNYDTEDDVREHAGEIDAMAAAGPDATNTAMPELGGSVDHRPSAAEREQLGAFLACMAAAAP